MTYILQIIEQYHIWLTCTILGVTAKCLTSYHFTSELFFTVLVILLYLTKFKRFEKLLGQMFFWHYGRILFTLPLLFIISLLKQEERIEIYLTSPKGPLTNLWALMLVWHSMLLVLLIIHTVLIISKTYQDLFEKILQVIFLLVQYWVY